MDPTARADVLFFPQRERLRAWFEENHATAKELWIGYFKQGSGKGGVTYAEAVEEALCFGWIDGQVRSLDEESYANRYTPRRPGSRWSRTNVTKAKELERAGRLRPAGLRAFRARDPAQPAGYSFEERPQGLSAPMQRDLRAAPKAWRFYRAQPPYYRRMTAFWVMSARREATRRGRLQALIDRSALGRRIDLLSPPSPRKAPKRDPPPSSS
ncbi:MAG: YdeI/OmpD-associated family protein [Thermoplasmata archaeon]